MTLRKIKNDDSVKYIHLVNTPPIETSKYSNYTKLKIRKKSASNKELSEKNKIFFEKITAEGFRKFK